MIRGSVRRISTASLSPLTTLKMPSGSPASRNSSARRSGTEGSRSDGFRTNALPQAMAGAAFHSGIMAGKLNGVIPATTPRGWRIEYTSMPVPALSVYSPFSRCGMPIANSTTSSPRWISPLASGMVFPCSEESRRARDSISRFTSSTNFMRIRARRCGFVAAQPGWAAAASSIAASTSLCDASGTRACTSPVWGLKTSANRLDLPVTCLPPMKWGISRVIVPPNVDFGGQKHVDFRTYTRIFPNGLCMKSHMNESFDWDALQSFLAVVRTGKLTTAARKMGIDHSTLSRRMAELERALQTKLFDRSVQGYALTPQGEKLLASAQAVESIAFGILSEIAGSSLRV